MYLEFLILLVLKESKCFQLNANKTHTLIMFLQMPTPHCLTQLVAEPRHVLMCQLWDTKII